MKGEIKIKIHTSFGEKWVVSFLDKKTANRFIKFIDNPEFIWSTVYPMFMGNKEKVVIRNSSIVALEILEHEEEKDNE